MYPVNGRIAEEARKRLRVNYVKCKAQMTARAERSLSAPIMLVNLVERCLWKAEKVRRKSGWHLC